MLSISIVTYNNSIESLNKCLSSFINSSLIDIVCIYENSEVPCLQQEEVVKKHTKVIYCSDKRNLGYGFGHNQAFRLCHEKVHSKYHLVMNLDVEVSIETINTLVSYMETSPNTLHCMPKVLNSNLSIQHACKRLPSPLNLITRRFFPSFFNRISIQKQYELRSYDYSYVLNCPYLSGCFMLLRSRTFEQVGMFDTRFFMYPEDIDLTRRLHQIGKTECYPFVSIIHHHEQASYSSWRMTWVHVRSMIKYFNKWGWVLDSERRRSNTRIEETISLNSPKN
ncbi:glycosyl transferase family 2 [Vibrio inusitatus NBRC 102082]|uniref:Glycosyl transferase family 2 n=1 Tax=Vibrio inusitatus NBRC 102082 TaxID=1219070 RepID=A0A4Y3I087_9VIBR|nr:glycosyl transferase family 2 [Vibrio inusitatus NBRC 102082]